MRGATKEHTSYANLGEARVLHSDYELTVDFGSKTIAGCAKLTAVGEALGATTLVLDTRDLAVTAVKGKDGAELAFSLGEPHKVLGSKLTITLPSALNTGDKVTVAVHYSTSPSATALQWLEPQQTAGGEHPYLFSQCQAIHARSFVPCQDTPGAKMTYSASITVPEALTALMSAIRLDEGSAGAAAGTKLYKFEQKVPIPSYLIALAVGALESRELGPRSRVWSEPSMVDAGAYEFAETEEFIKAGEAVAGPYVWGRYDLLLLPPSFPYGGMENPCLTFVTPTLLAGDRSLANVVAHEIAHSWFGNLVTNVTWEHFWLNEGWTVFLERKILGHMYGEPTLQFHAAQGAGELAETVAHLGASHPFTCLVPDLSGGLDPDDAFSKIPYEKGFYFLYYLQEVVGKEAFEGFMKEYVQRFQYKTLSSEDFKADFLAHFAGNPAVDAIDWATWFTKPGMPPVENSYDHSLATASYELAKVWHTADVMGIGGAAPPAASAADTAGWSSQQTVAFLDKLAEYRAMTPLHPSTARRMNDLYALDASSNSEIRCSWYLLCIKAGDGSVLPRVTAFLKEQGRMKFLRPLYRALFNSGDAATKALALDTFKELGPGYHPIASKMLAADLGLREAS